MRINALQKTTMLDFPQKISCIVFTQGCNFTCPYCYNHDLIKINGNTVTEEEIFDFLKKRRTVLEGVVITGGEPTLQEDLKIFCEKIKDLGYAIKLDTNGSNPQLLEELLQLKLIDYVALDIKADPCDYPSQISKKCLENKILACIDILAEIEIMHEFRVTCVSPFINEKSFLSIVQHTRNQAPLFLQKAKLENVLNPEFFLNIASQGRALDDNELLDLQKLAEKKGQVCIIR